MHFFKQNLHFPDKPFEISQDQEPQQMEPREKKNKNKSLNNTGLGIYVKAVKTVEQPLVYMQISVHFMQTYEFKFHTFPLW